MTGFSLSALSCYYHTNSQAGPLESGSHAPGQHWQPIFEQIIDSLPWNVRGAQRLLKAEKFEGEAGRACLEVARLVPCLPPQVPAFCPGSRPAPGCCLITPLTDRDPNRSPNLPRGKSATAVQSPPRRGHGGPAAGHRGRWHPPSAQGAGLECREAGGPDRYGPG